MEQLRLLYIMLSSFLITFFFAAAAHAETNGTVTVLSFDGMRDDLVDRYVSDGKLPNIEKIMKNGTKAKYARTISPSLTAPSHAAIATGATPDDTGFVSNKWKDTDQEQQNTDAAFASELGVPAVWQEARKHGKTTATVAFAGANPRAEKQADYSIYYGETWAPSNLESLRFTHASGWKGAPESEVPLKEAQFTISIQGKRDHVVHVLAAGTSSSYNRFILSEDKQVDEQDEVVERQEWGALALKVKTGKSAGFWFKLKQADKELKGVKMYRTAVTSAVYDGPEDFAQTITGKFGFFPAQDDSEALEKGWISRSEYEEISSRFVTWVTDVSLFIKERYRPDLLMFYAPQIDHEEHQFLMEDERQPDYSKANARKNMKYIGWAYKLADETAGKTYDSLGKDDRLLIVSDHGMEPVHTAVYPNKILKDAGLLAVDEKGRIEYEKSKAYVITNGGAAHVYVKNDNERLKEKVQRLFAEVKVKPGYGTLSAAKKNVSDMELKQSGFDFSLGTFKGYVKNVFAAISENKVNPFEKVTEIGARESVKHPHAGDLLLITKPGFAMEEGHKDLASPAAGLGTHGGDPDRKKLHAVFFAAGKGVEKERTIGPVSTLDIAPTIYEMLAIRVPEFVEGSPIRQVVDP
ncbi:alkaline phosphatase family protein [Bacillus marinisedimentorum]|uniref:alkaline phosphatase family protein n=1 Tax=Bacillus marinisedimentorum TaxID=1821260 RepID=UPI000872FB46|nr:alkaline phosphatase family protein [Bacillus marinisedimentorum]